MVSWGTSWLSSWGSSWGASAPAPVQAFQPGSKGDYWDAKLRKHREEDEILVLLLN